LDCSSKPVACHALQAQKDKADMTKRLELLELQGQGGGSRGRPQQAAAGFSTWIVLLIAVLSFLVGKYLAVSRPSPMFSGVHYCAVPMTNEQRERDACVLCHGCNSQA
jgi:hypothetical protein